MTRTLRLWLTAAVALTAAARAAEPTTVQLLDQRLPEVAVRDLPLDQAVQFLGELTKVNIVVRWQMLGDAGIPRDTPISLQVRNLRLAQVLWLVMNEVGGGDVKLAYRASGSLLVISTEEDLGREMVTKVYDVSDLLARVHNAPTSGFGLPQARDGDFGGCFADGSAAGYTEDTPGYPGSGDDPMYASAEMRALVELIQNTIEPDTWVDRGGRGRVRVFRQLLVVHNALLVHQQIGGYLREGLVVGRW